MNLLSRKLFLLPALLGGLFLFNACSDSDTPSAPAPVVTAFTPESGDPGTEVIITGKNFSATAAENIVAFNNITADVLEATATELKVVVPDAATDGKITVTVKGNTAVSENEFTIKPGSFLLTAKVEMSSWTWVTASVQDGQGNTYVAGNFDQGSVTFGNTTLTTSSDNSFVAMYNDEEGFVWAAQIKCAGGSYLQSSAVDASGNVYVTGYFSGAAIFGDITLSSDGSSQDVFVAKYNASGQAVWAKRAGGQGLERAYGIATRPSGDIFITGQFASEEAFFGDKTITAAGASVEAFVASCDSDGNFTAVSGLSGTDIVIGKYLATDAAGNLYLAGDFYGTMNAGGKELASNGMADIFMVKYTGNDPDIDWAENAGGAGYDRVASMTVDASGNLYIATYGSQIAIEKYTASGSSAWEKELGSNNDVWISGITLDETGSLYSTGEFYSNLTFGSTTLTLSENSDAFVIKQDVSSGNVTGAMQTESPDYTGGLTVNVNSSGNVYLSGYFLETATFGQHTATAEGDYALFFWKFRP